MINNSKIKNMTNQNNPQNPGPPHLCKTTTTPVTITYRGIIATMKKIVQFLKELTLFIAILAAGTIVFIVVSPWILAAYMRNRRRINSYINMRY